MNDKTNVNSRFIKMLIALFVPELIAMIIIFVLLKNEVINVLMAFIFMIIVFGIMFAIVFGFIRTLLIPIRAAITGVSSDDKGNEKITDKIEKGHFVDTAKRNEERVYDARINREDFAKAAFQFYITQKKKISLKESMIKGYKEMAKINLSLAELGMTDEVSLDNDSAGDIAKVE